MPWSCSFRRWILLRQEESQALTSSLNRDHHSMSRKLVKLVVETSSRQQSKEKEPSVLSERNRRCCMRATEDLARHVTEMKIFSWMSLSFHSWRNSGWKFGSETDVVYRDWQRWSVAWWTIQETSKLSSRERQKSSDRTDWPHAVRSRIR